MFGLPRNYPGKHALMLLIVAVLLMAASVADHFISIEGHEIIDASYAVPIVAAAFILTPFETLATGLLAMIFELTSEAGAISSGNDGSLWSAIAVGGFGVAVTLLALLLRNYVQNISSASDSLDASPLAYAELDFPVYSIRRQNDAFGKFLPPGTDGKGSLLEILPEAPGRSLAGLFDKAASSGKPVSAEEFPVPAGGGQNSYWNLNIIPAASGKRANPESISIFALDVTGGVERGRIRDAALRISSAVMSSLMLEETLQVVIDSLAYIAGTDAGGLFLIEEGNWIGAAGCGLYDHEHIKRMRLPFAKMPLGVRAVEDKLTIALENVDDNRDFEFGQADGPDVKSALIVPLVTGNRRIGAAWLNQTVNGKKFTEEQVEFATAIGAQAALAIDNAAAYENELAMRKSLEAIEAVSEAGLASLDLDKVLSKLVASTQTVLQMDAAMVMLEDDSGNYLEARAAAGNHGAIDSALRLRIGEGLAGRAFQECAPMKIDDISGREEELCPDSARPETDWPFSAKLGIRSVLAVPLRIDGRVTGILQVGSRRDRAFASHEWGLIQVMADRASMAVQNSLLHEEASRELARVALLREVAAASASVNNIKSIAERALGAISQKLGCQTAGIFYFDPKREALVNIAFSGHPDEVVQAISTIRLDQDTFLVRAIKKRQIITDETHGVEEASETEAFILRSLGIEHCRRAAIPFIYKGEIVGGMTLAMKGIKPFSSDTIDVLKGIANQLAVAIRNARIAGGEEGEPKANA